jgi:hypothetical protein
MQSRTRKPEKTRTKTEWPPLTYLHAEELGKLILPLLSSEPQAAFEVRKVAGKTAPGVTLLAVQRALALLSSKGLAHRFGGSYSTPKKYDNSDAAALRLSRYTERFILSERGAEFLKKRGNRE